MNWSYLALFGGVSLILATNYFHEGRIPRKLTKLLLLICIPLGMVTFLIVEQGQIRFRDLWDFAGIVLWSLFLYSIGITGVGSYYRSSQALFLAGGLSLALAFFSGFSIGFFVFLIGCAQVLVAASLLWLAKSKRN
ncbi:hypothetical protein [Calderihabitans maritimus]|uniref:Uncharacterized protein n=1 Tax=Calderihabitans maritimus TaxID=1246530 RepID=A0A1Z5HPE8_9FIRM|nr:hypothetical protein [Calderihabitans maritimus]GAW91384.1 hypothetical protein KKC1_05460 [Calderihabitans maritimus]